MSTIIGLGWFPMGLTEPMLGTIETITLSDGTEMIVGSTGGNETVASCMADRDEHEHPLSPAQ